MKPIDVTRRHIEAFMAALNDTGHDPRNVAQVLREFLPDSHQSREQELADMVRYTKELLLSPEKSRALLIRAGILDQGGGLAEPYRDDTGKAIL